MQGICVYDYIQGPIYLKLLKNHSTDNLLVDLTPDGLKRSKSMDHRLVWAMHATQT